MPKEKSPGKPTTRRYSEAEKAQAVRLVRSCARSWAPSRARCAGSRISWGYGVESVRKWVRDADVVEGLAGADAQRVAQLEADKKDLEQELREVRRSNEILKKASAFFAAELDRPQR